MPFRSLDDLRHLIEDEFPMKVKSLLREHADRRQHGCRVMPDEVYVDRIVRAMTETECKGDPDDGGQATKADLPRFMLRH